MTNKLYCPHCGRCLGECVSSDDTGVNRVLVAPPARSKKKRFIHDMKCVKCKQEIYIVMEFQDK